MSVFYFEKNDDYQRIGNPYEAAQTFRPNVDINLEYIDLNLTHQLIYPALDVLILPIRWLSDPSIKDISHNWDFINSRRPENGIRRMRYRMWRVRLYAYERYVIRVRRRPLSLPLTVGWWYDAVNAQYPGGWRYFSENNGLTWQSRSGDDHTFGVFGEQLPISPKPPAPIDFIAIVNLDWPAEVYPWLIKVGTNAPCHLSMLWTKVQPQRHPITLSRRGRSLPDGTQYCFVTWQSMLEYEPSDHLDHYFFNPTAATLEHFWFTFQATVNNLTSPSSFPIFESPY